MSAKDLYHDTVKAALIKDGWTITDDPFKKRGIKVLIFDEIQEVITQWIG